MERGESFMAKTPQERLENKTIRELRKENMRLRRQLKDLRKRGLLDDEKDEFEEDENGFYIPEKIHRNECPSCSKQNVVVFPLGSTYYYRCEDCNSKGKFKLARA
jgi:predicted  nucleic acid-binding Zn ribbon protein